LGEATSERGATALEVASVTVKGDVGTKAKKVASVTAKKVASVTVKKVVSVTAPVRGNAWGSRRVASEARASGAHFSSG